MKQTIFFVCAISFVSSQSKTRAELRSVFNEADFIFNLAQSEPAQQSNGGSVRVANLINLPALSCEGVSHVLLNIDPCGLNAPHIHPRAAEIVYVIDGDDFEIGFVEENGGRAITNRISTGFTTFIPRGLIHYGLNLSCKNTTIIGSFNSEDPGVISVAKQTLMFPNFVLSGTFGISESEIDKLRNGLPANPSLSFQQSECFKRCGIKNHKINTKTSRILNFGGY
jgi:oxalate decarboxylase/phosphoglucose isomerase-like protein (cupin superfamily)